MAIYQRPHSVEVAPDVYLARYGSADTAKQRLFNIGAGSWSHPYWTNVDLPAQTAAFAAIQAPCLHHDLVASPALPFESGSVDAFYCSHVVEHLPESAVENLINEAHRCLAPRGTCRIVTGPCADLDWSAMRRGDRDWWFWMNEPDFAASIEGARGSMTIYDRWLYHLATPRSVYSPTPCDAKFDGSQLQALVTEHTTDPRGLLDLMTEGLAFSYTSPGDHISWWNYPKLEAFLRRAGFASVVRSGYGQSSVDLMRDLRYFDQTYPQISVYAEAVK
jgi:SAM-dependent methyltransferase